MGAALWEVFTEEPALSEADSIALLLAGTLLFIDEVSMEAAPTLLAAWFALLLKTFWFWACRISARIKKSRELELNLSRHLGAEVSHFVYLWIDTMLKFASVAVRCHSGHLSTHCCSAYFGSRSSQFATFRSMWTCGWSPTF